MSNPNYIPFQHNTTQYNRWHQLFSRVDICSPKDQKEFKPTLDGNVVCLQDSLFDNNCAIVYAATAVTLREIRATHSTI